MEQVFDLDALMIMLICFLILFYVILFEGIFVGVEFYVVDDYGRDDAPNAPALDRQNVVRVACLGACIMLRLREVQVSGALNAQDIRSYLQ